QKEIKPQVVNVESDWSSASYYYSLAAISQKPEIKLNAYSADSLQGDASLVQIYREYFGVTTQFDGNQIILSRETDFEFQDFELNLNGTPDLAQTLAVTCAGLKIKS